MSSSLMSKNSVLFIIVPIVLLNSCIQSKKESGEELAQVYCGSCHLTPSPSLLPKDIWQNSILPKMALRLGIGDSYTALNEYPTKELKKILELGIFPAKALISQEQYEKIKTYYLSNSPSTLIENKNPLKEVSNLFVPIKIETDQKNIVSTQFFDSKLIVGSRDPNYALTFDTKLLETKAEKCISAPVMFGKTNETTIRLEIGKMDPTELSTGQLFLGNKNIFTALKRPVYFLREDLNNDKTKDWVICNFGNEQGNLSLYDGLSLKETVISTLPGARIVYHLDVDNDGQKELVALFTQSNEQVTTFKRNEQGEFNSSKLLEFPPVYGSSYFEMKDFNNDGKLDIILTNGDNADLSPVFKPYHGVRIFLKKDDGKFVESFFYPVNGASKVLTQDFDNDGDLDFVVISFFPKEDLNEGFIFFENQNSKYIPTIIPNISSQPWLTMDIADFDSDGDQDIVLGSYSRSLSQNHLMNKSNDNLILLRNNKFKN